MSMYFTIALRNLVQARRRTLLVGFALAMVTSLLVFLLALSAGLSATMIRAATTLMTGHVNIAGWHKSKPSDGTPIVTQTSELRRIVETETPGLDYVIDRGRGWARLVSETGSVQVALYGLNVPEERRFFENLQLAAEKEYREGGRDAVLGDPSRLAEPDAILLFMSQAKVLGVTVGDQITLTIETFSGARNTMDAKVVAVAKDVGFISNWNAYLSQAAIRSLYQLREDTSGAVMIYLKDVHEAGKAMKHLTAALKARGYDVMEHDPQPFWMKFETVSGEDWVGQRVDLTTWSDEVSFLTWALTAVDSISAMLIGILLVIIVIGITNSMWISVRERTQEVGTLRAIGMSRRRVLAMFLIEAFLLGLGSTAVGATLGAAFAFGLNAAEIEIPVDAVKAILMSDRLNLMVKGGQVVASVLVFTVITALAALFPALRAARLQPVTAIQSVS